MHDRICAPATTLRKVLAAWTIALLTMGMAASAAWPQVAPSPTDQTAPSQQETAAPEGPAQTAPQQEPAPPPRENPGLLNEIGKLFEKPSSMLPALRTPGEVVDDFNARAKDAAKGTTDTLSRFTTSPGVTGREACPTSSNGAPDCKAAADKLCQSKGFKEGKSLNTDAAEKCSAKVFIPGRKREPGDCRTENFVTRAICL